MNSYKSNKISIYSSISKAFKGFCFFLLTLMLTVSSIPMNTYAKGSVKASTMKIESVQGSSFVNKAKASSGMQLYSGDTLSTDKNSAAFVSLDKSKLLKLAESSAANVSNAGKKLVITLASGEIFFDVKKKLASDETMNVASGSVSMAVRGTSGVVKVIPGNDGIHSVTYVYDGRVDMSTPAGTFTVWGGEAVDVNLNTGAIKRDLIKIKNMNAFEQDVIAADADVIQRASVNMDVATIVAASRARAASAPQNETPAVTQPVQPAVVTPVAPTPVSPATPTPAVTTPTPVAASDSGTSGSGSSDSGSSDSDGGGSGGGSSSHDDKEDKKEDKKEDDKKEEESKPDSSTCDHAYSLTDNTETIHVLKCSKCNDVKEEAHTYGKPSPTEGSTHTYVCSVCEYNKVSEHEYATGKFDSNGATVTEAPYYTRACACGKVDESSLVEKESSSGYTVIFVDSFGKTLSTQTVAAGGSAVPPVPATVEGYNFVNFSADYHNINANTQIVANYEASDHNHTGVTEAFGSAQTINVEGAVIYYETKCTKCSKSFTHYCNFSPWAYQDDSTNGRSCQTSWCGFYQVCSKSSTGTASKGHVLIHTYVDGKYTATGETAATEAATMYTQKCTLCGHLK